MVEKRLVSAKEVAEYLGVHKNYVYQLVAEGTLPAIKVGSRFRFSMEDIENHLRGGKDERA